MIQPDLLSWSDSQKNAERGIAMAVDHADAEQPGWSEQALAFVVTYAASHDQFMAEDAREYAHKQGLPLPPEGRAWGYVLQSAAKRKLIVRAGYQPARSSNGSPKCLWSKA